MCPPVCVCPVFQLPPAARPPFTIQTASLRGSALRHERGHNVRRASGPSWPPPRQHWHNTWGGLTSCLSLGPALSYRRPSCVHTSKGQQGHFSSFLSCVLAVFLPPSGFPSLYAGSCNHTHFQNPLHFHKCSPSIKGMKGAWRKEEVHGGRKEGGERGSS